MRVCSSVCVCVRYGNEAVHRARAWLGEQQQRKGGRGRGGGQCNNVVNSSNYTRRWGSQVRQLSLCCGRRGNWQWSHNGDWEATVRMSVISCSNSNSNGGGSGSVDSVWSVRLKFSIKVQFIDLTSVIRHNNSARLALSLSLSPSCLHSGNGRPGVPLIDGCMPHRPHSAQYICREQRNRNQTCG